MDQRAVVDVSRKETSVGAFAVLKTKINLKNIFLNPVLFAVCFESPTGNVEARDLKKITSPKQGSDLT